MAKKQWTRLMRILTGKDTGGENEFSRLERFAHFVGLVIQSFNRNRGPVRAAALSYTTLLALVPLLAVAMSVTSSLLKKEGEEKIYSAVDRFVSNVVPPGVLNVTNNPPDLQTNAPDLAAVPSETNAPAIKDSRVVAAQKEAASSIHQFIQNTRSGTLGGIGMLLLVVVAIQMLASIEATLNDIWGITRGRSWVSRVVLYWTTITLGPLLIVGALGLAGGGHLQTTRLFIEQTPIIGSLVFKLLPLVVIWIVFAMIYGLLPNTKVKLSAALAGALVSGTLWHLNNMFGFLYVSRVVSYSKIYGGLGLVPVFMAGIYLSWLILLFGAQVAYAFQNRQSYLQDKLVESVNQRGKEFIALRLITLIGQHFQRGEPPVTLQQMSAEIGVPTKLIQQILQPLLAARIITEIASPESAFTPARPLADINAHHVLRAMRAQGQETATRAEPVRAEVLGEFARIEEAERDAASKITLLSLVERAQKQLEDAKEEPKARGPKSKAN